MSRRHPAGALGELFDAVTALSLDYDLSREQASDIQRAALIARDAHPDLPCGADLLGQMDIDERFRERLLEALVRVHSEGREVRDPPGQLIMRNFGATVRWKDEIPGVDYPERR